MKIDHFDLTGKKTFIIAELSANHNQKKQVALDTVKAAKDAGADAIKLQSYTPDTITLDVKNEFFQIDQGTLWDGRTLYDLYQEAYMPWDWHEAIFEEAAKNNIICFSSPFDFTAVDLLEKLNAPAYKIASFEIQDIPLIEYAASKGKPMIMSTGIADLEDINLAVEACRKVGNNQIVLLKCTSSYPAKLEDANLETLTDMKQRFGTLVGLSDHTPGFIAPAVAVAKGAKVVEKHFILDKHIGGPDASFSLNPAEFKTMVDAVRQVESSLGEVSYELSEQSKKNKKFSRSLFIAEDVAEGEVFTEKNVRSVCPGQGLHPKYYAEILGKKAAQSISKGTPLSWELIQEG